MISLSLTELRHVLTPALIIHQDDVEHNIATTLRVLRGDVHRWRPHVKTVKLATQMRRLIEYGVKHIKCATTLELQTICEAGARDVLMAYPCWGARAHRVQEIAARFPKVCISTLIDNPDALTLIDFSNRRVPRVGAFVDLNPGMDRTGIQADRAEDVINLIHRMDTAGIPFRGLHYYDGNLRTPEFDQRMQEAFAGYERLLALVERLISSGIEVPEVITSGTPAFPCALEFAGFRTSAFTHRVSPGTVVYNDTTSLAQLPSAWGYRSAVVVLTTVISHPAPGWITTDAGHKTVSADAGDPTCSVVGHPNLSPAHPSEEHLPMRVSEGTNKPKLGEQLLLIPRHVCPTVNNFDHALIVRNGQITGVERVTARGRETSLVSDSVARN